VTQNPPPELAGVSENECKVCATVCYQIYTATSLDEFNLPQGVALTDFSSDHDSDHTFAIVTFGNTLILAWRATKSMKDWMTNFCCIPRESELWSHSYPNLKAHGGYTEILEKKWPTYCQTIESIINKGSIKRVIFTGHSLGGGMATVAHVVFKSQMNTKLSLHTVAFAPMTISIPEPWNDENKTTKEFVTEISNNTCNII
jgi:hypothetical protein